MKIVNADTIGVICIWCEAQGESFIGKVCVGEVIRERVRRWYSSKGTVASAVAKRYQFSFMNDDKQNNDLLLRALEIDDSDRVVQECRKAWYASETTNYTKGAVLYLNKKLVHPLPAWAKPEKITLTEGNHTFYLD